MTAWGVQVREALRVTDGRYFSYLCHDEDCCPSHGTAFDPTTSAVAAAVTVAGFVALPDRATLSAHVAPIDGAERQEMNQATERALMRLSEAVGAVEAATVPEDASALICQWGIDAIRQAFDRYQHGERLSDDETAELTLLLTHPPVRDHAWVHSDASDEHLRLWTDLTRRARPDLAAAPASLLAFTAWQCGNGALANVALDRALTANPGYRVAQLLRQALQAGISPSDLADWAALAADTLAGARTTP